MALENYDGINGLLACIKPRYEKDALIFVKALQLYTTFTSSPNWPENYENLDFATDYILGVPMSEAAMYYKFGSLEDVDGGYLNFWDEFKAFCLATSDVMIRNRHIRSNPLGVSALTYSRDLVDSPYIMKIIRNDEERLIFNADKNALSWMMDTLKRALEEY